MDLNTIESVTRPTTREGLHSMHAGDAWLGGGTWLFSEPQTHLSRLVDLTAFGWPPLEACRTGGLIIAATCTVAQLEAFEPPTAWLAGSLFGQCCNAFLASFKIWHTATVGGNLCIALPAGPMISLCAALDGSCLIWTPDGGERRLPVVDFVIGPQQTALRRGELLRRIDLPQAALMRRTAFRRVSLTPLGRSGALLIGTRDDDGRIVLTITASTRRPVQFAFDDTSDPDRLRRRLEAEIPMSLYHDDVHGAPDWRRHVTRELAEEIRAELEAR